jgi:AcrR family transcriptional regulator
MSMGQPPGDARDATEFDATQQTILDAAVTTIARYGFRGTTTRRIAQTAGVNEVTLFRRKAGLMQAGADQYTGDLEADLTGIVAAYRALAERRRILFPLLPAELPRDPAPREAFAGPLRVLGLILGILRRHQEAGDLRTEPLDQSYAALVGPIALVAFIGDLVPGGMGMPGPAERLSTCRPSSTDGTRDQPHDDLASARRRRAPQRRWGIGPHEHRLCAVLDERPGGG